MNTTHSPFVSLIVVNWNGVRVLQRCLDSLARQTFSDFEIILVDNGSTDHSIDEIAGRNLNRIKLETNRGFAVANNIGVKSSRGKWIGLVNNDAFPEPEWLAHLIEATVSHAPQFTFFSSRLIQSEDQTKLDGTSDVYHISGLAWRRHYDRPAADFGHTVEQVFSPCAAAALYPREAFIQAGGFDEDFFSYHEDVDL